MTMIVTLMYVIEQEYKGLSATFINQDDNRKEMCWKYNLPYLDVIMWIPIWVI